MTPTERAEKILSFEGSHSDNKFFTEFLIAQIEEAQREAVEWKVKEILSEPGMMAHWQKGVDYGFRAAKEKAKRIAQSHECSIARLSETCNCDIEIAQRIGSLEP